ncbi:site-specific DNA methylase [Xenococcus sp. PCC 7305]|uniref:DNA cytosine methyltransferase n=1 Tax=Xenococcus sp. PCC 7305 TaxID=102125 RepID=UPI0002AC4E99|nr:DNA cytosine methyltransferase [Xenococcus sp. PCC 7305]ELS01137.1 site-specific DNA methylase [Xenococcus sp. PCC 7305]
MKLTIPSKAPIAVVGFAGGGGVECGLLAAGIRPALSIEFNPQDPKLSSAIADCHEANFSEYGKLLRMTVEDWTSQDFPDCPDRVDVAHFSPMCSNFSVASHGKESEEDIEAAKAIAAFIEAKQPSYFSLENVVGYKKSQSSSYIIAKLEACGYSFVETVLDFADYGVCQSRSRYFIIASKQSFEFDLPKQPRQGWLEVIGDLLEGLPLNELTKNQQAAIAKYQGDLPCLLPRVGYSKLPRIRPPDRVAPTITKSLFVDDKGCSRNKVWNIWDGNKLSQVDIECFRRLATFPDWYQFPKKMAVAGSILGYAVPPTIIEQIYRRIMF